MHRKVAAVLVAALALGAASCGGSGTDTLTRAQLARRMEVACRQAQRQTQQASASRRAAGAGTFIDALVAGQSTIVSKIDGVDASDAAKADFDTFKESVQQRLTVLKQLQSTDRADLPSAMRQVEARVQALTRKVEAAAKNLGAQGCL